MGSGICFVSIVFFKQSDIFKFADQSNNSHNADTLLDAAGTNKSDQGIVRTPGKETQWTRELTKRVCVANKERRPGLKNLYDQIISEDAAAEAEQKENEDNARKAALLHQLTE